MELGWATSTTATSSAVNPAEVEAMQCLEEGTQKLEEGDVQAAKVRGISHISVCAWRKFNWVLNSCRRSTSEVWTSSGVRADCSISV